MEMGIEFSAYLRYVAALIFVLVLIWLAGQALKRGMGHRLGIKRPNEATLRIQEILPIDSRHKLVVINHRKQEHLILLGNDYAKVIAANSQDNLETNITNSDDTDTLPIYAATAKPAVKKEPTL